MKINQEVVPYLKGEKFSNGLTLQISRPNDVVVGRLNHIVELCRSKKVVHVGFADHLPLIDDKIKRGKWLHKLLLEATDRCLGIDVNKEAIDHVAEKYNIKNIYEHNIITNDTLDEVKLEKWDYMILGEILEHVDNPVLFLENIRKKYKPYVEKLIITVPNAFELTNLRYLKNHKECVNSDHRFWFTPYTLSKIAYRAGWEVNSFTFCQSSMPEKWYLRLLLKKYPAFRETLAITLK